MMSLNHFVSTVEKIIVTRITLTGPVIIILVNLSNKVKFGGIVVKKIERPKDVKPKGI